MFAQEHRLAKVRDFALVMNQGRWVRGRFFSLKVLSLAQVAVLPKRVEKQVFVEQLRFAISVGVKLSKSAVKRNRLKRQVREVIRPLLQSGALEPGYYVLVVAQKGSLEHDFAEISKEIQLLLRQARILKA